MAMLLAFAVAACHKEEAAVEGVARTAANAEHKAQAAATLRVDQRAILAIIPLPTKSMYVDIREAGAWANPFLSVEADSLDLRVNVEDSNLGPVGDGTMLRPAAARRQELQLRPSKILPRP